MSEEIRRRLNELSKRAYTAAGAAQELGEPVAVVTEILERLREDGELSSAILHNPDGTEERIYVQRAAPPPPS